MTALTVSRRLMLIVALVVIGLTVSLVISSRSLATIKVNGPVYKEIIQGKDLVADILPPPEYIIETYLVVLQTLDEQDAVTRGELLKRLEVLEADYNTRHEYWDKALAPGTMRDAMLIRSYEPARTFYDLLKSDFVPAVSSNDIARARSLASGPLKAAYQAHRVAIDETVTLANEYASANEKTAERLEKLSTWAIFGISGTLLVLVTAAVLLISSSINRALTSLAETLSAGTRSIARAVGQVTTSSESLADGASQQSSAIEETGSSLEEMASMTRRTAETSTSAAELTSTTQKAADRSKLALSRMSGAMADIERSTSETAKIIRIIDELAFRTNLLALNAAVEAARAGDAGRGFSVVAEEVRNLALRSAEAAKNTNALIAESVNHTREGVAIADEVTRSLGDILDASSKVSSLVSEISVATREQTQGIQQVNQAVQQISTVTQSNSAAASESASAAAALGDEADSLSQVVERLLALVGRGTDSSGTAGSNPGRTPSQPLRLAA